jgi:hypothetical protein
MLVTDSAIDEAITVERGYRSLTAREALTTLPGLGFSAQVAKLGSGLLFPLTLPDDPAPLYQFRPDHPRQDASGKITKYEIPHSRTQRLILHPRAMAALQDGQRTLYITEGAKKVDSLLSRGATALGVIGVWSFSVKRSATEKRHNAPKGLLPDWRHVRLQGRHVVIVYDSDAALNADVEDAEQDLAALLRAQGARVDHVRLPSKVDGMKQGVDDYFAQGHSLADLEHLVAPLPRLRFDTINAVDLFYEHIPPVMWIIPGTLPAGCTLFVGRGKDGKSLMVWNIAMAVAEGGKALGAYDVAQGDVLYLALEDGKRRGQARLWDQMQHFDMDKPPPRLHLTFWEVPRIGEGFIERLETWADEHPDGRLVIVDILEKVRPPRTKDGMYTDDYRALTALQTFGQQRNVGILVVHHSNKTKWDDFRSSASGSTGLEGGCDTFWSLHRLPGSPDAVLKMVGREVEQQEVALLFRDGFWSALGASATVRISPERQEILEALGTSSAPQSPIQITQALGKEVKAIRRLLGKMLLDGQLIQPAYGVYTLPSYSPNGNSGSSGNCGSSGSSGSSVYNLLNNNGINDNDTSEVPSDDEEIVFPPMKEELPQELPLDVRATAGSETGSSCQAHKNSMSYSQKKEELPELPPTDTFDFLPIDFSVTPAPSNGYGEKEATTEPVTPAKSMGAAHTKGTAPPWQCVHCRGTTFWTNAGDQPVCSRCHPQVQGG